MNSAARSFLVSHGRARKTILIIIILLLAICSLVVFKTLGKNDVASAKPALSRFLRVSPADQSHTSFSCDLITPLTQKQAAFEVPLQKEEFVELGIVRTDSAGSYWGYSGEYQFAVYLGDGWLRKKLFETKKAVALNERFTVEISGEQVGARGKPVKLVCEIQKADKGKAKEYQAFKDFAFVAPHVFTGKMDSPNILLLSFDTLRPDHLGYNGYKRDTSPNIDAFARENIVFTQAISPSSWTSPAHYSLFTGLNPSAYVYKTPAKGNKNIIEDVQFMPAPSVAEILQKDGYYTVAFTGGGLVGTEFGFGRGFNQYWEYNSYIDADSPAGPWVAENDTGKIFDNAIGWLERNREKKFFMFLHHYECHTPYENPYFLDKEAPASLIEQRKALYDGDIRRSDEYFGRLMDTLGSLGLTDNTMIIFLSDHGEEFYDHYSEEDLIPKYTEPLVPQISIVDHAHSLYEELIRVPLIMRIPGIKPTEQRIENQVRLIDVAPTILDCLNIKAAAGFQGVSLLSLIKSGKRDADPPAISEFLQMGPERKSIRKDGFKYIWIEHPDLCWNFNFRNINQKELFDLRADPKEQRDLSAQNAQMVEQRQRMLEAQQSDSRAIHEKLQQLYGAQKDSPRKIDKDVAEQLKGLGYLN